MPVDAPVMSESGYLLENANVVASSRLDVLASL